MLNTQYAKAPIPAEAAANDPDFPRLKQAAEETGIYRVKHKQDNKVRSAALILHDVGSKEERKEWVEDFKAGKIDLLFV